MNSGVTKLYKLIFLPFFALCLAHTLNAQPIITQVKVTNSDCKNNGVIEVVATGISGIPVYKLDKMKLDADGNPTEEVASTQQNTGIGQNKFLNLEEGKYYAYIYDDVTGLNGVKSVLAVVKSTYRSFLGSVEVSQSFISTPCSNSGSVTFKIATDKPGKAPYSYVLTNNETNEKWELLNSNSTSRAFSQLPSGTYSYTVSDACGSSFYSNNLVVESRETAKDIELVSFKNVGQYVSANSDICSSMGFYISDIGRGELNGTTGATGIARTYSRDLEYQIDYPAGSNTWKYATAPGGVSYLYIYITDFDSNSTDPNYLKYKIRVVNKCNNSMAEDPTVYELGKPTTTFSFSSFIDYTGLSLCTIPDSAEVTIKSLKKIGSYSCIEPGKYPLTITLTQISPVPSDPLNPPVIQYIWTEENAASQGTYKMKVPTNTTYKMTIVDGDGTLLYTTNSYRSIANKPVVLLRTQASSTNVCDPTSYEIGYRISLSASSSASIKYNYAGWPIRFKILKAPEGVVIAPNDSIKEKIIVNTTSYHQTFDNISPGTYEIEVDKGCEKEIIKVAFTKYIANYEPYEPYSEAVGCKQHRLKVGAMFYAANGEPELSGHYIYLWWFNPIKGVYEYKERFNSYVGTNSGWATTKPMLETGKFVVRYSLYSNLATATPDDGKCDLGRYEIEVNEIYKAPEILLAESGGISCQLGQGADFTVAAENSVSRPFTYQIKNQGAPDSEYSVAQSDSIFRNVLPGEYDVKLNTNCDGVTSSIVQTMRMYDGIKDKFMSLTGSFLDGQACSDQSATFSLKAVGPVESYQWFKDGIALTEVITDISGRTYTIPNVTKADMGIYTLEINTGNCFLRSSDTIKSILPTPLKPTITSECAGTAANLTAIGSEPESTFIWYKNGVVVNNNTTNKLPTTGRGRYTVVERTTNGCLSYPSDPAIISYTEMYWKYQGTNQDWNDPNNWVDANGVALNDIPGVCTTVHIPGSESKEDHPSLNEYTDTYGKPTCETVVFHYGSQLRYPHVLNYKKALVRYNFGYYNGNNMVDGQPTANVEPSYPAVYRGNWKLLAAPLKSMVSGDFSLGGYPFTWQSQLNTTATKTKSGSAGVLTEASFAQPFATNDALLSTNNNAFAFKVTTYQNGVGYDNHKFLETHKGIIEYPYYENKNIMDTRPGYWVDPISGSNYLSYFDTNTLQTIFNPIGEIKRGKEAYRFVFENDKNVVDTIQVAGAWYGQPGYTQTIDPKGSDLVLVGNPFVASIDFEKFLICNADVLDVNAGYYTFLSDRIWHNKLDGLIEPLDAFVVKLKTTNPVKLIYPMELTLVESLRAAEARTAGSRFSVGATIRNVELGDRGNLIQTAGAAEKLYVPKLIYPEGHDIPEVYFVSSTGSMNLRQGYKEGQSEVTLGVKCSNTSEPITLTFHNVEALGNGNRKPVLIDKMLNLSQDLTENYQYTFLQRPVDAKKQYADNARFVISFQDSDAQIESQMDIRLRNHNELHVVSNTDLNTITIFDLQGRNVLSKTNIASSNYQQMLTLTKGVYIVKATTADGESKSQKISIK